MEYFGLIFSQGENYSPWELHNTLLSDVILIDVDKPDGAEIADAYNVNSFPTFLFVSADNGNYTSLDRVVGYWNNNQLLEKAKALGLYVENGDNTPTQSEGQLGLNPLGWLKTPQGVAIGLLLLFLLLNDD